MPAVCADSAAQRETGDAHILRCGPLTEKSVGREGDLSGTRSALFNSERSGPVPVASRSRRNNPATSATLKICFEVMASARPLRSGVEEVTFVGGNFADARTFPPSACRCHKTGAVYP